MKALRFVMVASMLFAVVSAAGAQEKGAQEKGAGPADAAAMQKMWEVFNKVGEPHALLQHYVGKWKTVTKDYMMNPSKPTIEEGTAEFTSILGGRFISQSFHGRSQGMPFEGVGMTGYDNAKKKYVGTWVDNMGTGVMVSEGTYDAATKTMTETMDMSSPVGIMKLRVVTEHKSDKEFVFTMYMLDPQGKESKAMEIVYTKA